MRNALTVKRGYMRLAIVSCGDSLQMFVGRTCSQGTAVHGWQFVCATQAVLTAR